jgi:hypothetical protein
VAGFITVLVTVAVTSSKNDAKEVFLDFSDNGGNYPLSKSCSKAGGSVVCRCSGLMKLQSASL